MHLFLLNCPLEILTEEDHSSCDNLSLSLSYSFQVVVSSSKESEREKRLCCCSELCHWMTAVEDFAFHPRDLKRVFAIMSLSNTLAFLTNRPKCDENKLFIFFFLPFHEGLCVLSTVLCYLKCYDDNNSNLASYKKGSNSYLNDRLVPRLPRIMSPFCCKKPHTNSQNCAVASFEYN